MWSLYYSKDHIRFEAMIDTTSENRKELQAMCEAQEAQLRGLLGGQWERGVANGFINRQ